MNVTKQELLKIFNSFECDLNKSCHNFYHLDLTWLINFDDSISKKTITINILNKKDHRLLFTYKVDKAKKTDEKIDDLLYLINNEKILSKETLI